MPLYSADAKVFQRKQQHKNLKQPSKDAQNFYMPKLLKQKNSCSKMWLIDQPTMRCIRL